MDNEDTNRGLEEAKTLLPLIKFGLMNGNQLLKAERSRLAKIAPEIMNAQLNAAYRYHILSVNDELSDFIDGRDYLDAEFCTPTVYSTRNTVQAGPITSLDKNWVIEVKKYYNTINIVVIQKQKCCTNCRIWLSIVVEGSDGRPAMRLRRRPLLIPEKSLEKEKNILQNSRPKEHSQKEYFAVDNILSEEDFQKAKGITGKDGNIRLGVIIRKESFKNKN